MRGAASARVLLAVAVLGAGSTSCSRNPATGRLQFGLVSEDAEVALGRESDVDVRKALGVYEDAQLAATVSRVGAGLAAQSERPELPWSFTVLDEPAVNAFALPGGWVYVTRGLLAHLASEDELAAVLGHEAGHVTARHGVVQLRKQRVAQRSVSVFRVVDPNLRHVGGIAARTAGLALLKHSRDDEHEADDLGFRYVVKGGYDANAITTVFAVLSGLTAADGGEQVPAWLSTHPDPGQRGARMAQKIRDASIDRAPVPADPKFLAQLEGLVYGPDPRRGFLIGTTFIHPRRGFQIQLPAGWLAQHDDDRVFAATEDERSVFAMGPSEAKSADQAIGAFFADGRLQRGEDWNGKVAGHHVASSAFSTGSAAGALAGLVAFVDYGGAVTALLAIGDAETWNERLDAVATTFASFREIVAKDMRDVQPMRIVLVTLATPMTLAQAAKAHGSVVEPSALALINHLPPGPESVLEAGRVLKLVRGFNPARLNEVVGGRQVATSPPAP